MCSGDMSMCMCCAHFQRVCTILWHTWWHETAETQAGHTSIQSHDNIITRHVCVQAHGQLYVTWHRQHTSSIATAQYTYRSHSSIGNPVPAHHHNSDHTQKHASTHADGCACVVPCVTHQQHAHHQQHACVWRIPLLKSGSRRRSTPVTYTYIDMTSHSIAHRVAYTAPPPHVHITSAYHMRIRTPCTCACHMHTHAHARACACRCAMFCAPVLVVSTSSPILVALQDGLGSNVPPAQHATLKHTHTKHTIHT